VIIQPKTGNILAMVSNPTYDPNALVSTSLSFNNFFYGKYTTKDGEGFYPLRPLADSETFFPGSTMKVVTSSSVYNLKPNLIGFDYPFQPCQSFSDSNRILCNDGSTPANSKACGGTMVTMLPESCDPGYGELGIQVGVSTLRQQAELFGINSVPPIDLPAVGHQPTAGVVASTLATLPANSQALQAYASIGQEEIADTALQNAMIAAGVANGGVVMTPHLMSSIRDSTGALATTYQDKPMPRSASPAAAQAVTALMESVPISGTASGVGFPSYLCAAVKTGTAQTGLRTNHDWMIGFAPANNPQIAVAVVVPFQNISSDGAGIAGPIVNKIMQTALPPGSVQQPCNVQMPPSSAFGH
jgi:penicillin-binding protein A